MKNLKTWYREVKRMKYNWVSYSEMIWSPTGMIGRGRAS